MKIRITLVRAAWVGWNRQPVPATTIVREFDDPAAAAVWFVQDSYFGESYTTRAVWEQVPA